MQGLSLAELRRIAGWHCVQDVCGAEQVTDGFTSDLLSDVIAHAPAHSVLITLQGHLNTVAVASLAGVHAIVLCSGRVAPPEMLEAAREAQILMLQTTDNQFQCSVKLHAALQSGHA